VHRRVVQEDPDPRLGSYERDYMISIPSTYSGRQQLPILFHFHGWGGEYKCVDDSCSLDKAGDKHGFIVIKPRGMDDGQPGLGSWNVGTASRNDTCVPKDVTQYNYSSCMKIGERQLCNCGTCYDDFSFISDLYTNLLNELCIDVDQVYGAGESFGGLFVYYAAPVLLKYGMKFRAIFPWYGEFYVNTENIPPSDARVSVFHFHGTKDTEIPPNGGESEDGYLYIPIDHTLQKYAESLSCNERSSHLSTPFDGRGTLLGCREYKSCERDTRLVRCNWNEEHGFWPDYAADMMWWFASSSFNHDIHVVV